MKEVTVTDHGLGQYSTLLVKDDVIIHKRSNLIKGVNQHSGKTYARFAEESALIYSWKRGRMRVYNKTAKKRGARPRPGSFFDVTTNVLDQSTGEFWTKNVEAGFQTRFGKSTREVFAREYPLLPYVKPAPGITAHLTAPDANALTLSMFGQRNYRKDLTRSVGGLLEYAPNDLTTYSLKAGMAVKGLVPTDWIVPWLPRIVREVNRPELSRHFDVTQTRRFFRQMSEKQLRRLLTTDGSLFGLGDSVSLFQRIQVKDPTYLLSDVKLTSFKDLHDILSRDERRMKEARIEIKYTGKATKFPGQYGDYRIVAPTDTWDLMDWGGVMNNCISGYGRRAATGDVLLYAVYDAENKMVANMELDPKGNVKQLLGKHNGGTTAEVQDTVYDAIEAVWPKADLMGGWQGTIHNRRDRPAPERGAVLSINWGDILADPDRNPFVRQAVNRVDFARGVWPDDLELLGA